MYYTAKQSREAQWERVKANERHKDAVVGQSEREYACGYDKAIIRCRSNASTANGRLAQRSGVSLANKSTETTTQDWVCSSDYQMTLRENARLLSENNNLAEINTHLKDTNAALQKEVDTMKREADKMAQDLTREMDELRQLKLQLSQQLHKIDVQQYTDMLIEFLGRTLNGRGGATHFRD